MGSYGIALVGVEGGWLGWLIGANNFVGKSMKFSTIIACRIYSTVSVKNGKFTDELGKLDFN